MPGSLFSHSVSPEPDHPSHQRDEDERHVHYDSNIPDLHANQEAHHTPDEPVAGSSGVRDEVPPSRKSLPSHILDSPLRPRTIPSVKAVVQRFSVDDLDVDSSLLLPRSSVAVKAPIENANAVRRPRAHSRRDEEPTQSHKSKGKQRERDVSSDLSHADTSGEMAVRGKERELVAAWEERSRNEKRWERDKHAAEAEAERLRDKERIRMLEREIAQLKAEVLSDFGGYTQTYINVLLPAIETTCCS
jgi:hypothetical protein